MSSAREAGNPLLDIEWEPCLLEPGRDPDVEAFARQRLGMVPPFLPYLVTSPWVARSEIHLNFAQGLLVELDDDTAELAAMAASLDNACRYCYATSRFLMRLQGLSENRLRQRERMLIDSAGSPRDSAMLRFVYRMSRSDPLISAEEKQALLDAGFSESELKELAFVVAYMSLANRIGTIPALSPQELEQLPDRWYVQLLRPLLWHLVNRHLYRGQPLASPPDYQGPYTYLVAAYRNSPIAGALAKVLTEAWGQTALSRRCKLLLFAVVAKALGCHLSSEQSQQLLLEEGLERSELEPILMHLRSPRLDSVEAVLVPFARQTVWYQPARVQRQAQAIAPQLKTEQFVEAIGVLALANALCRLGAAVVDHP